MYICFYFATRSYITKWTSQTVKQMGWKGDFEGIHVTLNATKTREGCLGTSG